MLARHGPVSRRHGSAGAGVRRCVTIATGSSGAVWVWTAEPRGWRPGLKDCEGRTDKGTDEM